MRLRSYSILILVVLISFESATTVFAQANPLRVPGQYSTLQSAVNAASSGDVILVEPGSLTGVGNHSIVILDKDLTIHSADGPDSVEIDCENSGFGFYVMNSNVTIEGLTIRNAATYDTPGVVTMGGEVQILNNKFLDGQSSVGAPILIINPSSALVQDNLISNMQIGQAGIEAPTTAGIAVSMDSFAQVSIIQNTIQGIEVLGYGANAAIDVRSNDWFEGGAFIYGNRIESITSSNGESASAIHCETTNCGIINNLVQNVRTDYAMGVIQARYSNNTDVSLNQLLSNSISSGAPILLKSNHGSILVSDNTISGTDVDLEAYDVDAKSAGISVDGDSFESVRVSGNTIEDSLVGGWQNQGAIQVWSQIWMSDGGAIIDQNFIYGLRGSLAGQAVGINCSRMPCTVSRNTVSNSRMNHATSIIDVSDSIVAEISDNELIDSSILNGAPISATEVADVEITGNLVAGIQVGGEDQSEYAVNAAGIVVDSAEMQRVLVADNAIGSIDLLGSHSAGAIYVNSSEWSDAVQATITRNFVAGLYGEVAAHGIGVTCGRINCAVIDNEIYGAHTPWADGAIKVVDSAQVEVSGNQINSNWITFGAPIVLRGTSEARVDDNDISENGVNYEIYPGGAMPALGILVDSEPGTNTSTISGNTIQSNIMFQDWSAGAIKVSGSDVLNNVFNITNNRLIDNAGSISLGAGVACERATCNLQNSVIAASEAYLGGAVYCGEEASCNLTNLTITGNQAELGGAVFAEQSSMVAVSNSILFGNVGGYSNEEVFLERNSTFSLRTSTLRGGLFNIAERDESLSTVTNLGGNISDAPRFVSAAQHNYELAGHSPCIDRADGNLAPETDMLGRPRFDDARVTNRGRGNPDYVDMGALERQTSSPSGGGHGGGRILPFQQWEG